MCAGCPSGASTRCTRRRPDGVSYHLRNLREGRAHAPPDCDGISITRIVVGVEGSAGSANALRWCAEVAGQTHAEVIVVHAGDMPAYPTAFWGPGGIVNQDVFTEVMDALQALLDGEWTQSLRDAGVPYRTRLEPGD